MSGPAGAGLFMYAGDIERVARFYEAVASRWLAGDDAPGGERGRRAQRETLAWVYSLMGDA